MACCPGPLGFIAEITCCSLPPSSAGQPHTQNADRSRMGGAGIGTLLCDSSVHLSSPCCCTSSAQAVFLSAPARISGPAPAACPLAASQASYCLGSWLDGE